MEATPLIHPRHGTEHDGIMSKHGDGAQIKAAAQGEPGLAALPTKPHEEGKLIEQQHEIPCDGSSPLTLPSSTAGNDRRNANAWKGKAVSQKKRKERGRIRNDPKETDVRAVSQKKRRERGKNWDDPKETDNLLKAVVSNKQRNWGSTRMDKSRAASEIRCWEAIAKEMPGRTGDECRGRMDTLKKSFSTIKKYCDDHQLKEFKDLNEKMFQDMKLSPRLTEDWFHQIRDHCPPTPKKKSKDVGAGSPSKSSGFAPCAGSSLGKPINHSPCPMQPLC